MLKITNLILIALCLFSFTYAGVASAQEIQLAPVPAATLEDEEQELPVEEGSLEDEQAMPAATGFGVPEDGRPPVTEILDARLKNSDQRFDADAFRQQEMNVETEDTATSIQSE